MPRSLQPRAAAYMRGYAQGVDNLPAEGQSAFAEAYAEGFHAGSERRRQIEEEAGDLVERRVRSSLRAKRAELPEAWLR